MSNIGDRWHSTKDVIGKKNSHSTMGLGSVDSVKMAQENTRSERIKECCGNASKLSSLTHLCMLKIIYPVSHFIDLT